jgi:3-isopropylmalate/(R)-2-methylmalate dehydratase large subunit
VEAAGRSTIAEEIIGAHAGRKVRPGEIVVVRVDVCMATDGSAPLAIDLIEPYIGGAGPPALAGDAAPAPAAGSTERQQGERGGCVPRIPGGARARTVFVKDHYVPCPNDRVARLHQKMDRFARENGIEMMPAGEGICHRLLPENGLVAPGQIIAGADSHSTTYGALGAFGTGIGSSDLAGILLTGSMWMRVPETAGVRLEGALQPGVYAKDLALFLVETLGAGGADYRALEFYGPGLPCLDLEARFTICNMAAETGAKAALMPFDELARDWWHTSGAPAHGPGAPEEAYSQRLVVDLSALEPLVAAPHAVDNVSPVKEWEGNPVNLAVLGTCTNGSLGDLKLAREMLSGRRLAPGVSLLVVPSSRKILLEASRDGIVADLLEAGATVLPPGCGPCCGAMNGVPGDGETVISTANRNFLGRMGNVKAEIFLASPATVVASAIAGRIADPRRYLP